ncbi:SOS-response repressor and protease LexA [Candidatus Syntrophocurvum alkaliphilum]|uniref:LexA repressor n=1 Tax=Candidatus Syntrophocurvum alkaliphilum TaxID=2293317 RepID=A0A6I6D916_9FIRM|nr:transcriptional repressor LexA [Candidatus Syntrophocurvum alkaliphilum]QGT99418.1 SOS-response repressor and protease LexA [Candidatus Syntrophocurvum alkaliphilum]
MTNLNNRQQQILDYIKEKIVVSGYPPSVREIAEAVGLKSSSTVHNHLVQLEEKGYLRRDPTKPRAIIPVENDTLEPKYDTLNLPVVGDVAAGTPILAQENIEEYFPVPVSFIGQGTHFILKVKGESMIDAGILDGDYLIVKQQNTATNGEIVVAMLNEEATVKRYFKRDNYIELQPENTTLEPITVNEDITILGKVAGLLRRM